MSSKLIASLIAPLALVGILMSVSEAQHPGSVVIHSGDGHLIVPAKPAPPREIADHGYAWEKFTHVSGEDYLREEIRYTNGDVESRMGPDLLEFMLFGVMPFPDTQSVPASVVSPSCNNVVQASTLQGSATTGKITYDASVLCSRIGAGDTPCNTFAATIFLNVADINGEWQAVPGGMMESRYSPGCGATARPHFDLQCPTRGKYYQCNVYLRDLKTNATLDSRTIYLPYNG